MNADAFQSAVIDGHEDSHGAVHQRDGAGGIGAPHLMRLVSEDRAVVGVRSQNPSGSARGQVVGLPHQAEDPALGGANPPDTEARPDFAVPFAHKRRRGQHLADLDGQCLVGVRGLQAALGWLAHEAASLVIDGRPAYTSLLAHADHTILALNGRQRVAWLLADLPATQGPPPRRRLTASRDSSRRIVRPPTSVFSRASSVSRPSAARLVNLACLPATKWPRHAESVAAVMPRSRDTRSSSSPRNNRKTASPFFREDNRPRSAFDFAMDTSFNEGAVCPKCVSKKIVRRRTPSEFVGQCQEDRDVEEDLCSG